MAKQYTAYQMRVAAKACEESGHMILVKMLRQAADVLDGIRNEISIIEKMPTADLDGAFENQKVNVARLLAKIAFYDKVKEIVGKVHNV